MALATLRVAGSIPAGINYTKKECAHCSVSQLYDTHCVHTLPDRTFSLLGDTGASPTVPGTLCLFVSLIPHDTTTIPLLWYTCRAAVKEGYFTHQPFLPGAIINAGCGSDRIDALKRAISGRLSEAAGCC